MLTRIYVVLSVFIISSLLTGCDPLSQSENNTLMLDFAAIIKATGKDEQVKNQLAVGNENLKKQLAQAAQNLNKQLADAKAKAGNKPTTKQKQELGQLSAQANQKMNEVRQLAQHKSQQLQATLVNQLRNEIKPIAESIAQARGAKAVLMISEPVLWFDASVDITADVIAALRAQPAAVAPPLTDNDQSKKEMDVDTKKAE